MPVLQEWKPSDIFPSTVYFKKVFSKIVSHCYVIYYNTLQLLVKVQKSNI